MAKRRKKRMPKHPKPKKGRCPRGYHKGKTKKTRGKCVKSK
jgi:hypothetical protein